MSKDQPFQCSVEAEEEEEGMWCLGMAMNNSALPDAGQEL